MSSGEQDVASDGEGDEQAVHARIAAALAQLGEPDTGTPPPPYVRRYLARHAQLGEVLDDEHVPPTVLPWETGGSIRGLLAAPGTRGPRHWLEAWAVIEPYLQEADVPSRLASLYLAYTALRYPRVPRARIPQEAAALAGSRLTVMWSQWAPPANVLATVAHRVQSLVAVTTPEGGTLLAAGDEQGGIELIDTVTGTGVGDRILGHDGTVRCLSSVSRLREGSRLVSGSTDGTVRIWDPTRGRLIDQISRPGNIWTDDLTAYVDDAGQLAVVVVNGEGVVTQWNEGSGTRFLPPLAGELPRASKAALTTTTDPTGLRWLVIADGTSLSFRRAEDQHVVREFSLPSPIRVLTPTTQEGRIGAGHTDGTVTVWDSTGCHNKLSGLEGPVTALTALSVSGRHLLAAGSGESIALWDINGTESAAWLTGHSATVTALTRVTVRGQDALASAAADSTVRLWNRAALANVWGAKSSGSQSTTDGAFITGDGGPSWLALSSTSTRVDMWDIATGTQVTGFEADYPVTTMAWAERSEGRALLWVAKDHSIRCWDTVSKTPLPASLAGHHLPVRALTSCITSQGRHLALSGGDDWTVRVWDLDRLTLLREWSGHEFSVRAVAAASNQGGQDWFASAGSDGTVRLWDIEHGLSGQPLRCRQGLINAIGINARPTNGLPPYLASGGDDGTIRLWNLLNGQPLREPLHGHSAPVDALTTWSTDGHSSFLASASSDGTIRIWDAATSRCVLQLATGTPVRTLTAHPGTAPTSVVLAIAGAAGAAVLELDLTGSWHTGA